MRLRAVGFGESEGGVRVEPALIFVDERPWGAEDGVSLGIKPGDKAGELLENAGAFFGMSYERVGGVVEDEVRGLGAGGEGGAAHRVGGDNIGALGDTEPSDVLAEYSGDGAIAFDEDAAPGASGERFESDGAGPREDVDDGLILGVASQQVKDGLSDVIGHWARGRRGGRWEYGT